MGGASNDIVWTMFHLTIIGYKWISWANKRTNETRMSLNGHSDSFTLSTFFLFVSFKFSKKTPFYLLFFFVIGRLTFPLFFNNFKLKNETDQIEHSNIYFSHRWLSLEWFWFHTKPILESIRLWFDFLFELCPQTVQMQRQNNSWESLCLFLFCLISSSSNALAE